jgi:hypothetical protein
MARRSVAVLQRELTYAQNRAAALAAPATSIKATTDKRPKTVVGYQSELIVIGAVHEIIKVQVLASSLAYFGGEAGLGLIDKTNALFSSALPRIAHFKPAAIHLVKGATTPTVVTAKGSKRPYKKYTAIATGEAQASYSAPISEADSNGITRAAQEAAVKAIALRPQQKADIGDYGRCWFTPEYFVDLIA